MSESMREILAREAAEAEAQAEAEERGDIRPKPGQRGRKRAEDPSQVYTVRIPVSRLRRLRELAEELGIAPSALIRQWVIDRLDESSVQERQQTVSEGNGRAISPEGAVRLGPPRRRSAATTAGSYGRQERRRA
jgi:chemotaxis protein histidine kinase CheA